MPRPLCPPGMGEPAAAAGSGPSCAGPGGEPGIVAATVRAYIGCGTERGPVSLDCDYVGASAPPQIRCDDNSPVIVPGADKVLKLGERPWLSQVRNCAIDPA